MKGLSLACVCSLGIFAAMTIAFLWRPNLPRVGVSLKIFAAALCAFLVVYFITPDNLGFWPDALLEKTIWLDLLVGFFVLAASFFGGWLQLYNLTSRGYSLRILIDLLDFPNGLDPEQIVKAYAEGRGLAWMYGRRLAGLIDARLVTEQDGQVRLTGCGRKAAQ